MGVGILEKIKEIEAEMARTQKNKATEGHLGLLKAKLARYKSQLLEGPKSSGKGDGFDVMKSGDARICLIGFPSVGKSSLLSQITETKSVAAGYEFTTLTCIPGVIRYKGASIQLLDLPGIIEGASQGKGRGRQVIAVARTCDMVIMMMDASKSRDQKRLLIKEMHDVGIRLNQEPPNITFKRKSGGGISFNSTVPLTKITERLVQLVCHDYKIFHAEILFREDASVDELIDVIEGNRRYLRCLFVYNKIDTVTIEDVDELARTPDTVVVSVHWKLGLDFLLQQIWEYLGLVRLFTKRRGEPPDFSECITMRRGSTIEHVCHRVHRDLLEKFHFAYVWGTSAKHQPQRVGLQHLVEDEDVVQVMLKF